MFLLSDFFRIFFTVLFLSTLLMGDSHTHKLCSVCAKETTLQNVASFRAKLSDGTTKYYCSLECLVVAFETQKIQTNTIETFDTKTKRFTPAGDVHFVLFPKNAPLFGKQKFIAFSKRNDAKTFAFQNRGKRLPFDEALQYQWKNLSKDLMLTQKIRMKKTYPMGGKIAKRLCDALPKAKQFKYIDDFALSLISLPSCKDLASCHIQVLALYLWDGEHARFAHTSHDEIHVEKKEKCPVCGMFVYKYPRWVAQIFYKDGTHYSFDGAKDMLKYYFEHNENIDKILLRDYYSQRVIDAKKAFYVIGSDIYGPMGDELIPFANEEDAKTFMFEHKGANVIPFSKITKEEVHKLDE